MKVLYLAGALSMLFTTACIVLKAVDGRVYNISAAKPSPTLGAYGQIKGVLKSRAVSTCMQGQVIDPAAWTETGQKCPSAK